ncbi:MAG: VWA domain-containing protein [Sulfurimonas sp.]|nr:VWA domain-containing protein [Sulfurimonas sp.]
MSTKIIKLLTGKPILELCDSIQTFIEVCADDDYIQTSAEISIATFSNDVDVIHPYSYVDDIYFENNLQPQAMTYMAKAMDYAMDSLADKISEYKKLGGVYKAPMLIAITDGGATDDITDAANRCADLIARKKLTFIGIGVGDDADMDEIKRFNPNGTIVKSPTHEDLKELLVFISYALSSSSQAGANNDEVVNYAELDPKFKQQ